MVYGNVDVWGNAYVSGNAEVYGNAEVSGNANVSCDAKVYGDAEVYDNVEVCDNAEVYGNARVYGNAMVRGNAKVCCDADYIVFRNWWSSGRYVTWTRSNDKWSAGCFYGSGEELVNKAYKNSDVSGREYKRLVDYVESVKPYLNNVEEEKEDNK